MSGNEKKSRVGKRIGKLLLIHIMTNFAVFALLISGIFILALVIASFFSSLGGGSTNNTDNGVIIGRLMNETTLLGGYKNDIPYGAPITGQSRIDETLLDHRTYSWYRPTKYHVSSAIDMQEIGGKINSESYVKGIIEKIMKGNFEDVSIINEIDGKEQELSAKGEVFQLESDRSNKNRVDWLNKMYQHYNSNWDFSYFKNYKNKTERGSLTHSSSTFTYPFYIYSTISGVVRNINERSGCFSVDGEKYSVGYCHYKDIIVKEGQEVGAGQILATMGMRGHTTGAHVHYEIAEYGSSSDFYFIGSTSATKGKSTLKSNEMKQMMLGGKIVYDGRGTYYFDHVGTNLHCLEGDCGDSSFQEKPSDGKWDENRPGELGRYISYVTKLIKNGLNVKEDVLYTIYQKEGVPKDKSGDMRQYYLSADGGIGLFQLQEPSKSDGSIDWDLVKKYSDYIGDVNGTPSMYGEEVKTRNYNGTGCNQGYKVAGKGGTQSNPPGVYYPKTHYLFKGKKQYYKNVLSTNTKEEAEKLGCDLINDKRFDFNDAITIFYKKIEDKSNTCDKLLINKKMNAKFPSGINYTRDSYEFGLCSVLTYNGFSPLSQSYFFSHYVKFKKDIEDGVDINSSLDSCKKVAPSTNCGYALEYAKRFIKFKESGSFGSYFTEDSRGIGNQITKEKNKENGDNIKLRKDKGKNIEGIEKYKELDFNSDTSITKFVGPNNSFNNKQYLPELVEVKGTYIVSLKGKDYGRKEAVDALNKMAEKYQKDNGGEKIIIASSFRDYSYQKKIIENGCSLFLCSKAGFSEHQSGLTFDLWSASSEEEWKKGEFPKRYEWLKNNAHVFGFTQSYQNGSAIEGYNVEPWHWRYVGVDVSTFLKNNNISFTQFFNGLKN